MAIPVTCPSCGHSLKVPDVLGGKRGKCPKCNGTMPIPVLAATAKAASPPTAAAPAKVVSTASREQIFAAFHGDLQPPKVSLVRKGATWLVLGVLLLLVLLYVAILGGLGWVVVWLATTDLGPQIPPLAVSLAMVAAAILLVCVLRPAFMPRERPLVALTLPADKQRVLADFVARIGELVTAPPPKRIQAECSTRLAADARGQSLTIGLPLFTTLTVQELAGLIAAELAPHRRRAVCGPAKLIRSLNGWLWYSVFREDRFDRWITRVNLRPGFHLGRLLLPLKVFSFPARAVLWVPMFLGNTIAAWLTREGELDADRCAARLIGAKAWSDLIERRKVLDFTWEGIVTELAFLYREQQLPDSLPHHLADRTADVTPELAATLVGTVIKEEVIPFDSRPTGGERQAAIAREPVTGLLDCLLPATELLSECTRLSRAVTFDYYAGKFGPQLVKAALRKMQLPGDPPPLVRKFGKVKS